MTAPKYVQLVESAPSRPRNADSLPAIVIGLGNSRNQRGLYRLRTVSPAHGLLQTTPVYL